MRKADPSSSRRSMRRRTQTPFPAPPGPTPPDLDRHVRKAGERSTESRLDSDFGICLCVVPALRRRSDA
jgi:hypothetical protein